MRFAGLSRILLSLTAVCLARGVRVVADDGAGRGDAGQLTIVEGAKAYYDIVLPPKALPTTKLAAEELRRFVRQATDVALPIVNRPSRGMRHIFLLVIDEVKPHGFEIEARGGHLYMRGRDSDGGARGVDYYDPVHRGTCNAVYEFLERFVGVRWFWGDGLGDVVPHVQRITVPADTRIRSEPAFDYRLLQNGPEGSRKGEWARRNRLGAAMTMDHAHALQYIVPVHEWARRGHPEYAAMRGGRRRTEKTSRFSGGHVCTSNPEVIDIVAQAAIELFRERPERQMFSISLPDGSGVCMCDEWCTPLDVPGYRVPDGIHEGWPIITDRILHFYNEVADRVSRVYPDRSLGGYIYMDYLYPPRRTKSVRSNVALVVTPNRALYSWDEKTWRFLQELYGFWGDFHDRVYAYDILARVRHQFHLPTPMGDRIPQFMRMLADADIRGAYLYIGATWEALGPEGYLLAKLLWDPHADADGIREEYYGVLYQRAAGAVRGYYARANECWKKASTADAESVEAIAGAFRTTHAYAREPLARLVIGYREALPALQRQVTRAERLAAGNGILEKRVARLRDNYELTRWTIQGLSAVVEFEKSEDKDRRILKKLAEAIEARARLVQRVGRTYGPELKRSIDFGDNSIKSPLQVGGDYHKLALGAR